jgi:hypothetical protein
MYPQDFAADLPDNVVFGLEDGSNAIRSVSWKSKETGKVYKACALYKKVISVADYMLANTSTMMYHLVFDIPQFVPANKGQEQRSRRDGIDKKLDAKGIPKVSWTGKGIYLHPHTSLREWERMSVHSGGPAFRQVLSDVFCMIMMDYTPPKGKTLLVSGMLSHPSKSGVMKACTKVYALSSVETTDGLIVWVGAHNARDVDAKETLIV